MDRGEMAPRSTAAHLFKMLDDLVKDADVMCAFVHGFAFGATGSDIPDEPVGVVGYYTDRARQLQLGIIEARSVALDLHESILADAVSGTSDGEAGTHAH